MPWTDLVEVGPLGQKRLRIHANGLAQIEMDIAIPQMAERHRPDARQLGMDGLKGAFQEERDMGHWHGDIMFDAAPFMALRIGHRFPELPERRALHFGLRDSRIRHPGTVDGALKRCLQEGIKLCPIGPRGEFHKYVPGGRALQAGLARLANGHTPSQYRCVASAQSW